MAVIENTNFLSINNFRLDILNLPETSFFVQSTSLPGISSVSASVSSPFTTIPLTGDHVNYEPLTVELIMDEEMKSYGELYTWLTGYSFPNNYDEYKSQKAKFLYSDIQLSLQDSNDVTIRGITFHSAVITSLSSVRFDYKNIDSNWATYSATFTYQNFTFS